VRGSRAVRPRGTAHLREHGHDGGEAHLPAVGHEPRRVRAQLGEDGFAARRGHRQSARRHARQPSVVLHEARDLGRLERAEQEELARDGRVVGEIERGIGGAQKIDQRRARG
jgi:hypothetical protein